MAKLTLSDLTTLANETSAINTINNNNTAIETALENTLSRDGTAPNAMAADIDMDGNRILNHPAPIADTDVATYGAIKSSETNAAASAAAAAANAALTTADVITTGNNVAATNADVVLTNADVITTGNNVTYSEEWAINPEDDPVSVAAGGDDATTFSSLHWAAKAAASAGSLDLSNYPNNDTGFEDPDSAGVTLNADISKIDVTAAVYFIHGVGYNYAGGTAISPTIGAGDSSTWVGLDSSETLVYQGTKFSDVQLETILPLARLQSVEGTSGPGSDLTSPVDLRYNIGEEGFVQRIWLRDTLGALFPADGIDGLITENATPLRIDQTSGTMYDAQRKPITITGDTLLSARALYHVSGTWTLQNNATVVAPLFYDDGTDIQALPVGKWAAHTLLRSPKDEDSFSLIYSQVQYNSQAEAEAAGADFGLFVSQSVSLFVPVANLIVKGNSTAIESIIDLRPKLSTTAGNVIGTATLQQIYDNSTNPEITTDTTRTAVSFKRGTAADTDDVFEVLNGAGSTTFSVDGNGKATGDGSGLTGVGLTATATEYTKTQNFNATTLSDAATIAWDASSNQVASVTLAGNRTLGAPTNLVDGATYVLTVKQDATGSRTLAYNVVFKFPGGTAPTLSTTANAVDILTFVSDGTNMYGVSQLEFS